MSVAAPVVKGLGALAGLAGPSLIEGAAGAAGSGLANMAMNQLFGEEPQAASAIRLQQNDPPSAQKVIDDTFSDATFGVSEQAPQTAQAPQTPQNIIVPDAVTQGVQPEIPLFEDRLASLVRQLHQPLV